MFTLAGYRAWPDGKQAAVREQLSDGCTQTERKKTILECGLQRNVSEFL